MKALQTEYADYVSIFEVRDRVSLRGTIVSGLPASMAIRVILEIAGQVHLLPGDVDHHRAQTREPGQPLVGPVRDPCNHDRLDIAKVKNII